MSSTDRALSTPKQTAIPEKAPPEQRQISAWWVLFTHPVAVFCWFTLAIALPTWEGYLNSAQTYIPDYETPLQVTFWISVLALILHLLLFPLARRYLILPLFAIISAFITVGMITDWIADCYGFQFNGRYGSAGSAIGGFLFFFFLYRAFLRDFIPLTGRMLWKVTILTALPIVLFSVYSFLKQNDFFKKRSGSYPVYQTTLQKNVWFPNRIKSIENFFSIDKNEHKE